MAGSFGYEAEHDVLSTAIGSLLREKLEESADRGSSSGRSRAEDGATVVAPGTSCRTQVGDFEGCDRSEHPVELLAQGLEE